MDGNLVVVIAGVWYHRSYFRFAKALAKILSRLPKDKIVLASGDGEGTDYLVFLFALRYGIRHIAVKPDELEGKAAIYRMHEDMLREASYLIVANDGMSKTVSAAAAKAKEKRIPVRIITVNRKNEYGFSEQKKVNGRYRSLDVRTLSRYRQRHFDKKLS